MTFGDIVEFGGVCCCWVGIFEKPLMEEGACTGDGKKFGGSEGSCGATWLTVEVVGLKFVAWI